MWKHLLIPCNHYLNISNQIGKTIISVSEPEPNASVLTSSSGIQSSHRQNVNPGEFLVLGCSSFPKLHSDI